MTTPTDIRSTDDASALRRSTELMVSELDRFETLLNDLLEISRHDAGVVELHSEQIDIEVPIVSAMATVRHLAEQSETELILDMPDDPVIVEADTRRVERVLRNLLANAIDHSEGKPVILTMRADDDAAGRPRGSRGVVARRRPSRSWRRSRPR